MNKFSLVIPVYKQEKIIKNDILEVLQVLDKQSLPFEIIVVIDGFLDRSYDRAKEIRDKRIKVVGYKTNHGKGYAVRFGFAQSTGNLIGFMDSGGDLNPAALVLMLDQMNWQKADVLIGSKRHPDSIVKYPAIRKVMSWGYQKMVKLLFGLNIRDTQVGMKIFKRQVLEEVLPRLLVKKFAFDIELLAVANHIGYHHIREAPVELKYNFTSTITSVNFWKTVLSMMIDTMAVFYRLKIVKYYDPLSKRKWRFDPELNFRVNIG